MPVVVTEPEQRRRGWEVTAGPGRGRGDHVGAEGDWVGTGGEGIAVALRERRELPVEVGGVFGPWRSRNGGGLGGMGRAGSGRRARVGLVPNGVLIFVGTAFCRRSLIVWNGVLSAFRTAFLPPILPSCSCLAIFADPGG